MAPFQYTYTPNPKISQIYNSLVPKVAMPTTGLTLSPTAFTSLTRTLPGGQTYQAPVVAPPVAPATPVQQRVVPVVPPQAPPVTGGQGGALDYSKYTDPTTGKVMSPQEYADFLAKRVTGGSIPNYAGNALTQGPQTTAQLTSTATDLNNQANDIATGTTDPYKAASKSGIAYSPSELSAIEKAYAGIYDPALKDVFAKLDAKQKQDQADADNKAKLAQMAQQHQYDLELKQTPTASESAASALASSGQGPYVVGANPVVDAWAQRIYDGTSKITDIPASDKGLRNAVTVALNANGNQPNGKSTTSALGVQALSTAKDLMNKMTSGSGTTAVGGSRALGGALFANIPGTAPANFSNDFNTLKSQLSLDAVKYLKGQGAVSDAERALLAAAVTKLNLSQSDDEFKTTLQGIIDTLKGGIVDDTGSTDSSSSGSFNVTDPDGGVHTFSSQADADAFKSAIGQ